MNRDCLNRRRHRLFLGKDIVGIGLFNHQLDQRKRKRKDKERKDKERKDKRKKR